MNQGWIKLHRKLLDWEWYQDPKMVHLFIHLLLLANHEQGNWQGVEVKRGQLLTGLAALSTATGLTSQNLRTCLKKLEKTGELTSKSTNRFRIITLCNYNDYQLLEDKTNKPANKQLTSNQQAANKPANSKQEVKNVKNVKNGKNKETINIYTTSFEKFWSVYPRKAGKGKAFGSWNNINPDEQLLEKILTAVKEQKTSTDWKKDKGKFIPHPTTWLNQERWLDELEHQETIAEQFARAEKEEAEWRTNRE